MLTIGLYSIYLLIQAYLPFSLKFNLVKQIDWPLPTEYDKINSTIYMVENERGNVLNKSKSETDKTLSTKLQSTLVAVSE